MLALSPPVFSTVGWPSEDPIGYDQNYFYRDSSTDQTAESFLHILPSQLPQFELDLSTTISGDNSSGSTVVAKKLNHNASERDRRKKINSLYSSMRSLLPADQAVCIQWFHSLISNCVSLVIYRRNFFMLNVVRLWIWTIHSNKNSPCLHIYSPN